MTHNYDLYYDPNRMIAIILTVIVGVIGRLGYANSNGKKIQAGLVFQTAVMAILVVFVGESILLNSGYKDYRLAILTALSFFSRDIIMYVDKNKTKYFNKFISPKNKEDEDK
ncbi:hypothetical protein [Chryseobacterium sp.]|uniref:hypothetical protein n=1 Tax=Chryseobacterium sp. TaxID=1871047 RepID=UPI0031E0E48E